MTTAAIDSTRAADLFHALSDPIRVDVVAIRAADSVSWPLSAGAASSALTVVSIVVIVIWVLPPPGRPGRAILLAAGALTRLNAVGPPFVVARRRGRADAGSAARSPESVGFSAAGAAARDAWPLFLV